MALTRAGQIVASSIGVAVLVFIYGLVVSIFHLNGLEATSTPQAQPIIFTGRNARLKYSAVGCPSLTEYDKLRELYNAHDVAAVNYYVNRSNCEVLPANSIDKVEDGSVFRSAHCLRVRGKPDCMWLPDALLEQKL